MSDSDAEAVDERGIAQEGQVDPCEGRPQKSHLAEIETGVGVQSLP
jgi:hypothetical protein